jgi:hypothetical protein
MRIPLNINCNNPSWLATLLFKFKQYFEYEHFLDLCLNKDIINGFKIFIKILPMIYDKNDHTNLQINILQKCFFNNIDIFINIDNNNHVNKLEELLGQKIPKYNTSNISTVNILINFLKNNEEYMEIVNNIYLKDDIFISKYI